MPDPFFPPFDFVQASHVAEIVSSQFSQQEPRIFRTIFLIQQESPVDLQSRCVT